MSLYPNFVIVLSREWFCDGKTLKRQKVQDAAGASKVRRVGVAISR
jgi:hypothetical protein